MLCNNDWSYREDGPTIVRYFLVPTRKVWGNCAGYERYLIGTLREREFQPERVLHAINTSSISMLASLLAVFGSLARLRAAPPRCGRVLCVVMSEVEAALKAYLMGGERMGFGSRDPFRKFGGAGGVDAVAKLYKTRPIGIPTIILFWGALRILSHRATLLPMLLA